MGSLQTFAMIAPPPVTSSSALSPVLDAEPAAPGEHRIQRSTDGLFYLKGKIDGVNIRFAVDTGATYVVLNTQDASRIGLDTNPSSSNRIRTASGYSGMSWHQADNLTIAGTSVGSVKIAVMQGGPKISLLGLNALSRLASVTMIDDELIIKFE